MDTPCIAFLGWAILFTYLLNKKRGAREWDEFKTVDDVLYLTYRDAFYALGLLEDDKEYINDITEASHWVMGD